MATKPTTHTTKAKKLATAKPSTYTPKTPEPRHCIVCRVTFDTVQPAKVFCSYIGPTSCWRLLDTYGRKMMVPFSQALIRQRYECFNCHTVDSIGAFLKPLVLRPDLIPILGGMMEPVDIVASCTNCRSELYLMLATVG